MPWNVVNKLENICIYLNKQKIKSISLIDLEELIIKNLGVTRETTINRYIEILTKLKWIKQQKKKENNDFVFEITYYNKKGELF